MRKLRRRVNLLTTLAFCGCLTILGQNEKVSIQLRNASLKDFLSLIESQTDYRFSYRDVIVDDSKNITLSEEDMAVSDILKSVLSERKLAYKVLSDKSIVISEIESGVTRQRKVKKVKGVVTTDKGEPIIGANVVIEGTTNGTITDIDGNFFLDAMEGDRLKVSYIGYSDQYITVGNQQNLKINMVEDSKLIDEVVVVAYGTTKKASFTGAASVVSSDMLEKSNMNTVSSALQGLSSGVQVVGASGKPGAESAIQIRGIGSINTNSDPLLVLDGSPYEGDLGNIAPSDIESMTVLKDAASTSLYGSRAANGVIMITTKSGKTGRKPSINFRATWGTSDFAVPLPEKVSGMRQYELVWEGMYNDYISSGKSEKEAASLASKNVTGKFYNKNPMTLPDGTTRQYRSNFNMDEPIGLDGKVKPDAYTLFEGDWYSDIFESKLRQEYMLDVSGGSEKNSYYFSASWLDDKGLYMTQRYKRLTSTGKFSSQLKSWLKLDASMRYTRSEQWDPGEGTRAMRCIPNSLIPFLWDYENNTYLLDIYGRPALDYGGASSPSRRIFFPGTNPLEFAYSPNDENPYSYNVTDKNAISLRNTLTVDLPKGFQYKMNVSADYIVRGNHKYNDPTYGVEREKGSVEKTKLETYTYTFNNLLTYGIELGEGSLNALLGQEIYSYNENNVNGYVENYPLPGLEELTAGSENPSVNSYEDNYRLVSFFTRMEYDWRDKYYISGSFRTDGSSRFHKDKRWGNFWSAGASWRISEENFMKSFTWIDNMKLKLSYGTTGNDRVGYYAYQGLFALDKNLYTSPGALESRFPTKNLTWEKNQQINAGIDFSLWNRLSGSFEYFVRTSDDLLFDRPLPPSFGLAEVTSNIGKIQNRGVELDLNFLVIRNKDFSWNVGLNLTHYKNEILELPHGDMYVPESTIRKWSVGGSVYDYYTPQWAGIDSETGLNSWYKQIRDEKGNIIGREKTTKWADVNNDENRVYQGSSLPDLYGSLTNSFAYKGFDLSFMFYFSLGGLMNDGLYKESTTMRNAFALTDMYEEKRWTPENREGAYFQKASHVNYADNSRTSDQWLFNNSFLRLRNINFGYTFPKTILSKVGITNLRLFLQGENLLTFGSAVKRHTDPESMQFDGGTKSDTYGARKTITGGINLSF